MNYYAEALADEANSAAKSGVPTAFPENKLALSTVMMSPRPSRHPPGRGPCRGDLQRDRLEGLHRGSAPCAALRYSWYADRVDGHTHGGGASGWHGRMGLPEHVINAVVGIQPDFATGLRRGGRRCREARPRRQARDLRDLLADRLKSGLPP